MGFNRMEAKISARASMRQTKPSPLLVTLAYVMLTLVLSRVVMMVVGDPWTEMLDYLNMGYDANEVVEYVILGNMGRIWLYGLLSLLVGIYEMVMNFGYTSYALRMSRNEQPGVHNLFDGFAKVGRILWAGILVEIFSTLWGIVFMVPAAVVLTLAFLWENSFLLLAGCVLMIAGSILMVAVIYRYRLTNYFLLDDPGCTAREAIRRSKKAMKGWKMELFLLDLSFLGWVLLTMLTMGVLSVWLLPYWCGTEANFYNCVTAGNRPSGGYSGTGYDYQVGQDPTPFQ